MSKPADALALRLGDALSDAGINISEQPWESILLSIPLQHGTVSEALKHAMESYEVPQQERTRCFADLMSVLESYA